MEIKPETARMVNHVDIRETLKAEKLAEGPCPNCKAILDIWLTGKGVELSRIGRGYDVQPGCACGSSSNGGEDGE
jgi:hypothetical protein